MSLPWFAERFTGWLVRIGAKKRPDPYTHCLPLSDDGEFAGVSTNPLTTEVVRTALKAATELGLDGHWSRLNNGEESMGQHETDGLFQKLDHLETRFNQVERRILNHLEGMEQRIMATLDDIDTALNAAIAQAQTDITRTAALAAQAVALIKSLQAGADPVHADAIVAKLTSLGGTLTTTANAALDPLDQLMNPAPAPAPTP